MPKGEGWFDDNITVSYFERQGVHQERGAESKECDEYRWYILCGAKAYHWLHGDQQPRKLQLRGHRAQAGWFEVYCLDR